MTSENIPEAFFVLSSPNKKRDSHFRSAMAKQDSQSTCHLFKAVLRCLHNRQRCSNANIQKRRRYYSVLECIHFMCLMMALTIWSAATHTAHAEPAKLRLEVRGDCPCENEIRMNLKEYLCPPHEFCSTQWQLNVQALNKGTVAVQLVDPDGRNTLTRQLSSEDCHAAGEAVEIIVQANFFKLPHVSGSKHSPQNHKPNSNSTAKQQTSSESLKSHSNHGQNAKGLETHTRKRGLRSENKQKTPENKNAQQKIPKKGSRASKKVESITSSQLHFSVALSGGIDISLTPRWATALGQMDLTVRWGTFPLAGRLVMSMNDSTTQSSQIDRIRLYQSAMRFDAAWKFVRRNWWYQPLIGVGGKFIRVEALDLPNQPRVKRNHPMVVVGFSAGYKFKDNLSMRVEGLAEVFMSADSYVIEPEGEVARSSWANLSFTAGLQFEAL